MTKAKKLCLNMIVRNEVANLGRCLEALVNHVDCWVICDTGSSDGTQDFVRSFFAARGKPGELHAFPFENFEQARNAALDRAYASPLAYDYLLLADADMELVVDDGGFRERLEAPGYRLLQRTSSGLAYWNTRLVRRDVGARYHGVTHEYIDVPGGAQELQGAWYRDHASGSNRVDKFERDAKLLLGALEKDPENHRYWYYLAQSYRDGGRTEEAAKAYAKRAEMGGWDEEAWHARLQEARCLQRLGDEGGFIRQALAAFNMRPQRAEPLYDLARFYRHKGMNDASVLFAEAGLAIKRPAQDILFLEDFVYSAGLHEEYSIAANYATDPARKDRGFAACNWLSLNRRIPDGTRELAWSNLYFYIQPALALLPSWSARPIGFTAPEGYRSLNPSVTRWQDKIVVAQRTSNYTVMEDGLEYRTPDDGPIQTRNFLLELNSTLEVTSSVEILPPIDLPEPANRQVLGFEDLRVFERGGALWGSACLRELTAEAWCEQVLMRLEPTQAGAIQMADWQVMRPDGERVHEKNWMPQADGERVRFVYLCDPTRIVDDRGRTLGETIPAIAAPRFRGGTQLVEFDGGWLALIHEVQWRPSVQRRYYSHRLVWFDRENILRRVSRPFYFHKPGLEFAAGLAWHPDGERMLVSFGVADSESYIATVDAGELAAVLDPIDDLPSGAASTEVRLPRRVARASNTEPMGHAATMRVRQGDADEQSSLPAVFRRWGTDKVVNGYAELYDCLFRATRRQVEAVLEIGIGTMIPGVHSSMVGYAPAGYRPGASVRGSRDYFPNAVVYGLDVRPDTQFVGEDRIRTFLCDSTDKSQVARMARLAPAGGFDIIIDDGSHRRDDQIATLRNLFPLLKVDGTYIVEDVIPGGIIHHLDEVRAICGESSMFFAGPHNNPLVITKIASAARRTDESPGQSVVPLPAGEAQVADVPASASPLAGAEVSADVKFTEIAPFLQVVDSPSERRAQSRAFDERMPPLLGTVGKVALPQIHSFYEVRSGATDHRILTGAMVSMRAAGHPVRLWTYSPDKLAFLEAHGVEVCPAEDVVPRGLFERIVAGSEIRYFSDVFRYAVLYEHGGLWMDADVILLRPFPFQGDHFFNLQWRGGHKGHYVCGNVMYAKPHSRHLRALYEASIDRFFAAQGWEFGVVGPKLLSDYIASEAGKDLRESLFSPMFFNSIDWTETDRFDKPLVELAEHLNDDRLFGIHLWAARSAGVEGRDPASLGALLADPLANFPDLTSLADRFNTDKNRHYGNRHCYARVYDRLLADRRFSLRRLVEVAATPDMPSAALWRAYFPFGEVLGIHPSGPEQVQAAAARLEAGSVDVIIDDGSHASLDQQTAFRALFPTLAEGGWYFIEDLDWQPPGEDASRVTLTKHLLREIESHGCALSLDPLAIGELGGEMAEILFFDSHYELARAKLLGGLVAIRKGRRQPLRP